jgi:hypothetical protein
MGEIFKFWLKKFICQKIIIIYLNQNEIWKLLKKMAHSENFPRDPQQINYRATSILGQHQL